MKKLYRGGKIITMEKELYAEALLTDGGRIAAVGSEERLARMGADETVDLAGGALLPGFIDAHSHFSQVAVAAQQVSLGGSGDMAERIRRHLAHAAPALGDWVIASGYDPAPGETPPTLEALDAMAAGHPLLIQYRSGHMALLSSEALRRCGVTPRTPDPAGGRIGRDGGQLTGYLEENAFFRCREHLPAPGGSGQLKLDLVAYAAPDALAAARETVRGEHIRLGGAKIFLDGSPQGRTAWMTEPYAGERGYRGSPVMTDNAVESALLLSGREGLQLLAHCNGDAAAEQFLRCLERAETKCPAIRTLRPVIIHAQLIRPDQLRRAGELGAMVSFFAAHVWHWGDVHVRNFGPERARRISPAASALALGVPFTFHQDAPVVAPDMLETIWCATERRTRSGAVLGGGERIGVLDALRAVTSTAAYQYFQEERKGTLRPGKAADLVLLSRDPLTVPPDILRDIRVQATVKAGETVYRA